MKNPELDLAHNFVEQTYRNLFLTGKAGTGKTTFLRHLKEHISKRMVIVAPTGVAAINAGGVTIHSFFQMPFGPIIPGSHANEFHQKKFNRQKINIIRTLDLLVIDEISMVRADLLDGIDQVLRRYKDHRKPFGGVQLLMIGDLQQLAPVIKPDEWELLSSHYHTPFFFSSKSFLEADVLTIELQKIYRQENQAFIQILEEIRNNTARVETLEKLNERYKPDFESTEKDPYIVLTSHNHTADRINEKELRKLKSKSHFYQAHIQGNFPEYAYPTSEKLELKKGAQVMFVKNDSSPEKRYYNGKIGTILSLDDKHIEVLCPGDAEAIEVSMETWENIKYSLDKDTKEIQEEFIGGFTQIPLKWAWAITIHKSQGLTFEKAIIDASESFAHGQTYVALSRCKSLEGIVLKSKINSSAIINDVRVKAFSENARNHAPDDQDLVQAQIDFQLQLITELFDFFPLLKSIDSALYQYHKNTSIVKGNLPETLTKFKNEYLPELLKISTGFKNQLQGLNQMGVLPENNTAIQERFVKGVAFYKTYVQVKLWMAFEQLTFDTDNREVLKDIEKYIDTVEEFLILKRHLLETLSTSFNAKKYLQARAFGLLQKETQPKIKKDRTDYSEHPDLFKELRSLRMEFSDMESVAPYQVFTQESLYEMCLKLPVTHAQLQKIKGMGKVRVQRYGQDIIEVIEQYCEQNKIKPDYTDPEIPIKKPKIVKGESYRITLDLFKNGKTVEEIAQERGLATSTIEGHVALWIGEGEILLEELPMAKKYLELKSFMLQTPYENLTELRPKIGEEYTFSDMRMVQNAIAFDKKSNQKQD